jgi:hypothetical protein
MCGIKTNNWDNCYLNKQKCGIMDDDNKTPHIDLPNIYGINMCKPSKLGG